MTRSVDDGELIRLAAEMMHSAYAPYSGYTVGAALLTRSGRIYTGCNIENAAFSPTVCAERVAFFKAIADGERSFDRIAVIGGKNGVPNSYFSPCGVCRQVMSEFCDDDFSVIIAKSETDYLVKKLNELLACRFSPRHLVEN